MTTLAVIPARAGSKGIPRKNMRLLNGKPLIAYAIKTAMDAQCVDEVLVSTDSPETLSFSADMGVLTMERCSDLADDNTTLDSVVFDALSWYESAHARVDTVITLQPTSPLLTCETLDAACRSFAEEKCDSMVSVINKPHLSWTQDVEGNIIPEYKTRLNRQELPARFLETGAFVISRRAAITEKTRFGAEVSVYEVPEEESVDIDDFRDWLACEALMKRKRILYRVDGYRSIGMGHIYRALTLAYAMIEHEVTFVTLKRHEDGCKKLIASNIPTLLLDSEDEFVDVVRKISPDIVIHDCLNTSLEYVQSIKETGVRLVTFEDLGPGSYYADATINALYESDATMHGRAYFGKEYFCLRDEFLITEPKPFRDSVKNVFVMFGGSDPLNMTERIYRMVIDHSEEWKGIDFTFLLGLAYERPVEMVSDPSKGVKVLSDVAHVSTYMKTADLAFTSQGRGAYELASLGVPAIVFAQNERELEHEFAQLGNGFINLGLGSYIDDASILNTFRWLERSPEIRREMRKLMLSNDLKKGINRVRRIILGEEVW